jgi:hypothetical protein
MINDGAVTPVQNEKSGPHKATELCKHTIQEEQLPFCVVYNGSGAQGKGPTVFEDLAHFMFLTVECV